VIRNQPPHAGTCHADTPQRGTLTLTLSTESGAGVAARSEVSSYGVGHWVAAVDPAARNASTERFGRTRISIIAGPPQQVSSRSPDRGATLRGFGGQSPAGGHAELDVGAYAGGTARRPCGVVMVVECFSRNPRMDVAA